MLTLKTDLGFEVREVSKADSLDLKDLNDFRDSNIQEFNDLKSTRLSSGAPWCVVLSDVEVSGAELLRYRSQKLRLFSCSPNKQFNHIFKPRVKVNKLLII